MYMFKKIIAVVLISAAFCSMAIGCVGKSNKIPYDNVVYDNLTVTMADKIIIGDNVYIRRIRTYENAVTDLSDLGVSQDTLSSYDEEYFNDTELLVLAFDTCTSYKHSVAKLTLDDDLLTVYIDEQIPNPHNLLAEYKVILIDISKGTLTDDVNIDAEFKTHIK